MIEPCAACQIDPQGNLRASEPNPDCQVCHGNGRQSPRIVLGFDEAMNGLNLVFVDPRIPLGSVVSCLEIIKAQAVMRIMAAAQAQEKQKKVVMPNGPLSPWAG